MSLVMKNKALILSISGLKESGKDTFYNILQSEYPTLNIVRLAFGDYLKNDLYELVLKHYGLSIDLLYDRESKEKLRNLINSFGTDLVRNYVSENHWIDRLRPTLEKFLKQNVIICITDPRFPNEIDYLKSLGAYSIKVEREGQVQTADITENALNNYKFDRIILNSDLQTYKQDILKLVQELYTNA